MQNDTETALHKTELPGVTLKARGKVRDVYDLGESLLIVATDRLSAFDWVLPNPIPDKGKVLNQISVFWFEMFSDLVPNHVISTDVAEFPEPLRGQAARAYRKPIRATCVATIGFGPAGCASRAALGEPPCVVAI